MLFFFNIDVFVYFNFLRGMSDLYEFSAGMKHQSYRLNIQQ